MSQKKYVSLSKLSTFLDNLYEKFASLGHKHTLDDITNYAVDSQLSSTSTNPVQNKVVDAEFEAISVAMNALESAIDGKSDASHNHDNRYYTETEIDTKLSSKSDTTHKHDGVYDTKGSAEAVQKNLNAVSDTLGAHTENSDIHVTTTNKSNWNTAYTHSQSTHARVDATKVADSTTNGNILINDVETNVYSHPNSGVSAGTYKSVTVNAQGHITAGSNPTTLSGYGITDAETKSDASAKLAEAKTYADNAAANVKNDLLNGAGDAYDTLKELGELIDDNKDAIDALEAVASGKADKVHTHAISDVTNLQSTLDGKAAKEHGTHVTYSTTAPVMDGAAAVGSASTVARSDHKHPTDTSRAAKTDLDTHTGNKSNPHGVTKAQIGLGNVDNTSDANKPLSTVQKQYVDAQTSLCAPLGLVIAEDPGISDSVALDDFIVNLSYTMVQTGSSIVNLVVTISEPFDPFNGAGMLFITVYKVDESCENIAVKAIMHCEDAMPVQYMRSRSNGEWGQWKTLADQGVVMTLANAEVLEV